MTDKRSLIEAKRKEHRERVAKLRQEANERRELQKQKAALHRAANEQQKTKYMAFKTDLVDMLKSDGVIVSNNETIKITYNEGHPVINGINLSARYGNKYQDLWRRYERVMSDDSYINILAGSYEIREISDDGASFHFLMQD